MKKTSLVITICVVAVISFLIGISLSGKFNNDKPDVSDTNPTSDTVSASVAEPSEAETEASTSATESTVATDPVAAPQAPSEAITPSEAKSIALKAAELDSADVWDNEVELDYENGKWVYEVSFEKNGTDYEYIINALTGEVLHSEVDPY